MKSTGAVSFRSRDVIESANVRRSSLVPANRACMRKDNAATKGKNTRQKKNIPTPSRRRVTPSHPTIAARTDFAPGRLYGS